MGQRRKPMKQGDTFETLSFGSVTVVDVLPNEKATVRFEDGSTGEFWRTAIVKGQIKNYMKPSVFGVGYLGQGTIKLSKCRAYGIWCQMLERCYTDKYAAYKDCYVCDDWLNFCVFKSWYESQAGSEDRDFQLDKDILIKGNREYSPLKCLLVPSSLNKLLENSKAKRGNLPLGVSLHKQTLKYTARCCDAEGGYPHLGLFENPDDAFEVYKEFKEGIIKQCAEKYKHLLPEMAHKSLLSWEIAYDE